VGGGTLLARYRPQLAECREQLREVVARTGGAEAEAMVGEAKLLRATLVLASGSPLGASPAALIHAAVSIELIHLASLVHDDIIDEAAERRGVPALHVSAGRNRALVVGDLLILAAFDALSQSPAAVQTLSKGAQLCCRGQLEELDPGRRGLSEDEYLDVIAKKTGSLFSVAASLGALVAGAGGEELDSLATFGRELGIAYQVRDDLRDSADDARDPPTSATYARATDRVLGALDRVPAACRDDLRVLVEAML
jgi:geranylgeranyl pyrophosphate synthase